MDCNMIPESLNTLMEAKEGSVSCNDIISRYKHSYKVKKNHYPKNVGQ